MKIRRAINQDIPGIMNLLSQVLEIHAAVRPDIFRSGTTKYTPDELKSIIADDNTPVYVGVNENESVMGYAFCIVEESAGSNCLVPFKSIYIDDLCVDKNLRGRHIGKEIFEFVKNEAKNMGCYEITLNVWEGNDSAKKFYEKMNFKPKKYNMEFILK